MEKPRLKATPHSSDISPITLNLDRIKQNFQHKSCRGKTDIELCRRKHRIRMSRFWDIQWNSNQKVQARNPDSTENRVRVELGFQFDSEFQSIQIAPDPSRKMSKSIWNWICSRKTDQKGGGIYEQKSCRTLWQDQILNSLFVRVPKTWRNSGFNSSASALVNCSND